MQKLTPNWLLGFTMTIPMACALLEMVGLRVQPVDMLAVITPLLVLGFLVLFSGHHKGVKAPGALIFKLFAGVVVITFLSLGIATFGSNYHALSPNALPVSGPILIGAVCLIGWWFKPSFWWVAVGFLIQLVSHSYLAPINYVENFAWMWLFPTLAVFLVMLLPEDPKTKKNFLIIGLGVSFIFSFTISISTPTATALPQLGLISPTLWGCWQTPVFIFAGIVLLAQIKEVNLHTAFSKKERWLIAGYDIDVNKPFIHYSGLWLEGLKAENHHKTQKKLRKVNQQLQQKAHHSEKSFCQKCYRKAQNFTVLSQKVWLCPVCERQFNLVPDIEKVIGKVGGLSPFEHKDKEVYIRLWNPWTKVAIASDIDALQIYGGGSFNYEWALNAVIEAHLTQNEQTGKKVTVYVQDSVNLSENSARQLKSIALDGVIQPLVS